eukprot:2275565-Rhodomonas_salina.1
MTVPAKHLFRPPSEYEGRLEHTRMSAPAWAMVWLRVRTGDDTETIHDTAMPVQTVRERIVFHVISRCISGKLTRCPAKNERHSPTSAEGRPPPDLAKSWY